MKEKIFDLKYIGGSHFLHVPSEYIKVFEMLNKKYLLEVKNNGDKLIYTKVEEINETDEVVEDNNIEESKEEKDNILEEEPEMEDEEKLQEEALMAI